MITKKTKKCEKNLKKKITHRKVCKTKREETHLKTTHSFTIRQQHRNNLTKHTNC